MLRAALRRNDGLSGGRPWLQSVVETLQRGLIEAGHLEAVDGRFGSKTEKALRTFQLGQRLLDNGIAGKATWQALEDPIRRALGLQLRRVADNLPLFDGDLGWVHLLEGHRGRPYWPGGASGVTLDPGVDLGHADASLLVDLLRDHYQASMSPAQRAAVDAVLGVQGDAAKTALDGDPTLRSIRVSREQAEEVFPVASRPLLAGDQRPFRPAVRPRNAAIGPDGAVVAGLQPGRRQSTSRVAGTARRRPRLGRRGEQDRRHATRPRAAGYPPPPARGSRADQGRAGISAGLTTRSAA